MREPLRIGLVVSYSLAYCRGILRGIKQYARTRQDWIFTPVAPEAGGVRVLRQLRPAGVIAHIYSAPLADRLLELRRPLVNVSGVLPDELPQVASVPRVGVDDAAVGDAAARHLLDRGLRHFAFVGHPDHGYSVRREAAFRRAVEGAGHRVDCYRDSTRCDPRGRLWALDPAVRWWVSALPRPVGLFACNDAWGVQLCEVCRQCGLGVPEDVALVGVDNDDLLCELARPSLSSVALPSETVGFEAAAMLERLMAAGRGERRRPAAARGPKEPVLLPPVGVVTRQSSDVLAIEDPDVAAAVRLIRQRCHEPLGIGDVVDAVAVSRRSLERKFSHVLSRGIADEIRRAHVGRARSLLAGTDLPVARAALSCGFSGNKQLSVVFRRETGLTPTAHRRRFRGAPRQEPQHPQHPHEPPRRRRRPAA